MRNSTRYQRPRLRWPVLMFAGMAVLGGLAGCSDSPTGTDVSEPARIMLTYDGATIESLNQDFQVDVRVLDDDGVEMTGVPLNWTIGNPSVIQSVGGSTFRSLANGVTTLEVSTQVQSGGELRKSVAISVQQKPAALAMGPEALSPTPGGVITLWSLGQTLDLEAWSVDAMGNPVASVASALTWHSEDGSVSTVSQSGTVTALNPGRTVIGANSSILAGSVEIHVDAVLTLEVCAVNPNGREGNREVCTQAGITFAEDGF